MKNKTTTFLLFFMWVSHLIYGQDIKPKAIGFFTLIEANFSPSFGTAEYGSYTFQPKEHYIGLSVINGYRFNEYFMAGISIGLERLRNNNAVPITLDMRAMFSKSKLSPMVGLGLGNSFGLNGFANNVIVNPSVGLRLYLKNHQALMFSIGYRTRIQQMSYVTATYSGGPFGWSTNYVSNNVDVTYKYMTLKVGFLF